MGAKSDSSSANRLEQVLAQRLSTALLPGDAPFSAESLAAAAAFLCSAANQRDAGEAAITIETVSGSAAERFMRIGVINDDMPFLVDSIATTLAAQGLTIDRLVHPVLPVRRNADGVLTEIPEGGAAGEKRESMVYIETRRADAKVRRALESALRTTPGRCSCSRSRLAEDATGDGRRCR